MNDSATGEAVGQDIDAVVVSRTIDHPVKEVWRALNSREGGYALLGEGAELGDKGDSWRADNGSYGVVRSYHPREQIRFSLHEGEDTPATLVQLQLADEGDATHVEITHVRHAEADRTADTERWEKVLDRIDGLLPE